MKKFFNVVKIILISLCVLLLGGYVVLWFIDKETARQIMDLVVEYANRPLPIVGVSSLVIATLIWKIFSNSIYGKKYLAKMTQQYNDQVALLKNDFDSKKTEYTAIIQTYEQEIDLMYNALIDVCNASANKKMKEIGSHLETDINGAKSKAREYFSELVNSDTETLIKKKDEIIKSIVESIKKEIIDKYGEQGEKAINCITEND